MHAYIRSITFWQQFKPPFPPSQHRYCCQESSIEFSDQHAFSIMSFVLFQLYIQLLATIVFTVVITIGVGADYKLINKRRTIHIIRQALKITTKLK